jgi:hypothetical protein
MTHAPEKLDELTPRQPIAAIRELSEQHAVEVPGARRTWSESIPARILALGRLGLPKRRIAKLSGIPQPTVLNRCRSSR